MPSATAITSAAKASSNVAGMRCRMTRMAGSPNTNDLPRSPRSDAADEVQVLLPQRPVEPERLDRALDLRLIGLRVDQQVDRIADDVHAGEHDHRHQHDHQRALHQPAEDECEHSAPRTWPCVT